MASLMKGPMMARVPRSLFSKLDLAHWEFFVRCNSFSTPVWTKQVEEAGSIFEHRGYTSMTGVQYVPAVKKFIMGQWAFISVQGQFDCTELCPELFPWAEDPRRHDHDETMLCLYEAPHPWGPWKLFHVQEKWGPAFYCPSFPAKWFQEEGKKMWIVESGNYRTSRETGYQFLTQQMELILCNRHGGHSLDRSSRS